MSSSRIGRDRRIDPKTVPACPDQETGLFSNLDRVMKHGLLLYTNISSIDIDIMDNAANRPQDVADTPLREAKPSRPM
jgi:hypothetical protein